MTSPTLHLLAELRANRAVLADAREQGRPAAVIAELEAEEAAIVEQLFEGGEVGPPVRCSFAREAWSPRWLPVTHFPRVVMPQDGHWLEWGGDEWPRRPHVLDDEYIAAILGRSLMHACSRLRWAPTVEQLVQLEAREIERNRAELDLLGLREPLNPPTLMAADLQTGATIEIRSDIASEIAPTPDGMFFLDSIA